tara:strand:- start:343 stop:1983 length:1641 start_codon:yes stop_codon:yes gene_type:complete
MVIDTSNFSFQGIGVVNSLDVLGCITLGAFNYNPAATVDDGSCEEVIEGCTNPFATNFDPFANTDSGDCVIDPVAIIPGCTDPTAWNYDPNANVDDGTCIPCVYGCIDPLATNYNPSATCDDGSNPCIYFVDCLGNQNGTAVVDLCGVCNGNNACMGCMDATACNYDPTATMDDGSCNYLFGCTNSLYIEFDPNAICDDGSCSTLISSATGCMNATMFNYDVSYTIACQDASGADNGTAGPPYICCEPVILGCTDPAATNTCTNNCNTNDSSCTYSISGCTDPTANNYNLLATVDDGSCTYSISGCTDPNAINYDATATVDDGSCTYAPQFPIGILVPGPNCTGCTNPPSCIGNTGGLVFYVFQPGDPDYVSGEEHGLMLNYAGIQDEKWGCQDLNLGAGNTWLNVTTSEDLFEGENNTTNIVNTCVDSNGLPLPSLGVNISFSNYCGWTDWYLPSKDELLLIHQNIGQYQGPGFTNCTEAWCGNGVANNGLNIGFATDPYWSSSQGSSVEKAWACSLGHPSSPTFIAQGEFHKGFDKNRIQIRKF